MSQPEVDTRKLLTVSLSGATSLDDLHLVDFFPHDWELNTTLYRGYSSSELDPAGRPEPDRLRQIPVSDEDIELAAISCREWYDETVGQYTKDIDGWISLDQKGVEAYLPGLAFRTSAQAVKASYIACLAIRRDISVLEAEEHVELILRDRGVSFPEETAQILVRYDLPLDERVEREMERADGSQYSQDDQDLLRQYLRALELVLDNQVVKGIYSVVVRSPQEPYIEVLAGVTKVLQDLTGSSFFWRPLLSNIKGCVTYCGLSESGKSSMSLATLKHVGNEGIYLKMSYLGRLAKSRYWMEYPTLATRTAIIIRQLDIFTRWHHFIKVVILGTNDPDMVKNLIAILGHGRRDSSIDGPLETSIMPRSPNSKLLVVYMDTPLELRLSRGDADGEGFVCERDEDKVELGVERIKDMADLVIDNTGTVTESFAQIKEVLDVCLKD